MVKAPGTPASLIGTSTLPLTTTLLWLAPPLMMTDLTASAGQDQVRFFAPMSTFNMVPSRLSVTMLVSFAGKIWRRPDWASKLVYTVLRRSDGWVTLYV